MTNVERSVTTKPALPYIFISHTAKAFELGGTIFAALSNEPQAVYALLACFMTNIGIDIVTAVRKNPNYNH